MSDEGVASDGGSHPGPSEIDLAPYVQTHPTLDITFYTDSDEVFVLFVSEPPTKGLFKVVGETENPRVLVQYEDAVVKGYKVTPVYQQDLNRVRTGHPMAGLVHKFPVDEMLDDPALLLDRIPPLEDTS